MKPMTKNMWREISANKGRFIAIILIILLGTLVFVGIKAAGPGLNDSLDTTVKHSRLSDVQLLSTTGFTETDVKTAEKISGAKAEAVKYKNVIGGKDNHAIALYGYTKKQQQNQLTLESGHFPRSAGQIVLDQRAKTTYHYRLGDTITFAKNAGLKQRTYTIVGFGDVPNYIDDNTRGATNIGDGNIHFFAYLPAAQLQLKTATLLNIRFSALQRFNTYDTAYKTRVAKKVTALKHQFKQRAKTRTTTLYQQASQPLKTQQTKLTQAKQQLAVAQKQAQANGQSANAALATQAKQLTAAQAKLDQAKQTLRAKTSTHYTWQTRADLPGFSDYHDSSERIAAIANVFPVFFFLIAALITFTTITRMVEEARSQIGTFKALGYGKFAIARNYLTYALMAGLIGAVLGGTIGNLTLPRIVISLYHMCIPLIVDVPLMWPIFGLAIFFALLATVGAAVIVVRRELSEKPAELMRPRAPKSAKRILMERITPLWRHLSFNQKVSYRNLFRYKSRMVMTIIGIAGGTALLLTGFGLRDSIGGTATTQFSQITHYDALLALKHDNQATPALKVLKANTHYQSAAQVNSAVGKLKTNSKQLTDITLLTPQKSASFHDYVTLQHNGSTFRLPQHGLVISQKIATQLHLKTGDRVTFAPTSGKTATIKVAAITDNYMGVYAYLSPTAYRQAFHKAPAVNTLLVRLTHTTAKQRNALAHKLLAQKAVMGTSFTAAQLTAVKTMSSSLNPVVFIFILLSGLLSFVVLYNLTNINVSERIRELSTIKVLGFFDNEVTMYIIRENIMLTIIGIVVGYGAGWALLAFILKQAATAQIIFPVIIHWLGYIAATLLMIGFTAIVMLVTHRKLQHIDMIEALKSNE
jgi:putative ABC transport system permease protein